MIEVGTILQDRYRVQQQVGAGGMGTVYLATDQRFDSPVAIKETLFTDDDLKKAFEREAHLLNRMRHPALPRVIDYFTEGDVQFLVMEYIAGADLSAILKQTGAFKVADVLRWADELLSALEYLHTQTPPVIHRDIKPQNLKLTTNGEIILLDFGLAKGKTGDTSRLSLTNSVFGYSRSYAPLEQIQGTGTDLRSDIYSLAATLYHLFTGKPPADALMRATAYVNNQSDPLLPVNEVNSEVPARVAEVLQQALDLNAGSRLQSATEMRRALRQAAQDSNLSLPIGTPAEDDAETTKISGKTAKVGEAALSSRAPEVKLAVVSAPEAPAVQLAAVSPNHIVTQSQPKMADPETPAPVKRARFRRQATESSANEGSWKNLAGIAAAVLVLGGGAFAWYASSQPTASQEKNQTQTIVNAPINRPNETRLENTKTAVAGGSNNSPSTANTTASSAASVSTVAQTPINAQTTGTKRPESIIRNNQPPETKPSEEEAAAPEEAAEVEETPRPVPSPIIVRSAPPTNNSRRNRSNDEANQNERTPSDEDSDDEPPPPPKPRKSNTPKPNTDDEDPPMKDVEKVKGKK